MLCLTVEDIVPNSIIELNKINGSKKVLIEEARKYGENVANYIKNNKGYYTLLKINPSQTESFEIKYGNFFKKYYQEESYGYQLTEGTEIEDIIPIFRDSIVEEVRDCFSNEEVIEKSFPQKERIKRRVLTKNEP